MGDWEIDQNAAGHRPLKCKMCGGDMVFEGVGEYRCEVCGQKDYDDYGKVRHYLEKNGVTNMSLIAESTGVDLEEIRKMVKEARFNVSDQSGILLMCERCGRMISSGNLCQRCEEFKQKVIMEDDRRKRRESAVHIRGGFERHNPDAKGARRFSR